MSSKPADLMAWTETLLPNILEDEESWNHAYVGDAAKVSRIAEYVTGNRRCQFHPARFQKTQAAKWLLNEPGGSHGHHCRDARVVPITVPSKRRFRALSQSVGEPRPGSSTSPFVRG